MEQTIARLQEELDNRTTGGALSSHLEEQLNDSRLELKKIIEFRTKGAILRRLAGTMKVRKIPNTF